MDLTQLPLKNKDCNKLGERDRSLVFPINAATLFGYSIQFEENEPFFLSMKNFVSGKKWPPCLTSIGRVTDY